MLIRNKSDEEIKGEVEGFVNYAQNKQKISEKTGNEILSILSENKNNIKNKNDIKNYMSSVLSPEKFDKLYDEYVKYYGDAGKQLKDFFEKNKFFPEGYNFLISNLFRLIYEEGCDTVDSLIKELNNMSQDDINKWRECIKNNIDIIKSVLPDDKDFRKLDRGLILYEGSEDLKENIYTLKDCGIHFDNVDDLNKFTNIIAMGNYTNTSANLHFLIEDLKIDNPDDLVCLSDIIKYSDTDKIKTNIPVLIKTGFSDVKDLAKLRTIIENSAPDKIRSNIPVLMKLGITKVEELLKLEYIINDGKTEILNELDMSGVKVDLNDINRIRNLIINGTSGNITALKKIGIDVNITNIKEKLEYIITHGIPENIEALKDLGFDVNINNIGQYERFIKSARLENLEFLKKMGVSINSFDDLEKNHRIITDLNLESVVALKEFGIEIDYSNISKFSGILTKKEGVKENIQLLNSLGINKDSFNDLENFETVIAHGKKENIQSLNSLGIKFGPNVDEILLTELLINLKNENISLLVNEGFFGDDGIKNLEIIKKLKDALTSGRSVNIGKILNYLEDKKNIDKTANALCDLKSIIKDANTEDLITVLSLFPKNEDGTIPDKYLINELKNYYTLLTHNYGNLQHIISSSSDTKEDNRLGYLVYLQKIDCLKGTILNSNNSDDLKKDILKLSFSEIDNYLDSINEFCIKQKHPYNDFLKCFDGKSINKKLATFLEKGFEIPGDGDKDDIGILNYSIKQICLNPFINSNTSLYQNIKFNEQEAKKILSFIDYIGGVNKGYTILILTMEKMIRDGVDASIFTKILCDKLDSYVKIIGLYPEDKVPEGLKISVGIEIEMTRLFANRYKDTTGYDYYNVVNEITNDAKIGKERDGIHEFATKPSTNPMVALLEIHLLQELNLLDINDMQKLPGDIEKTKYSSRNGTGYHLNIGSDSDIGINENIDFIQNLCTILPWSGISNGDNVKKINHYSNINSKSSKFSVFGNEEGKKYIELRTYSMDDVELFEKNVLFNAYAVMGNQAQKKSLILPQNKIIELKDNYEIKNSDELMKYLENNDLFYVNQDIKQKNIAVEFMWMQICVLRSIDNYNHNFIDEELFGKEIVNNLSEPWKNYFLDLLLSDKKESIGFVDTGISSVVVRKSTNLKDKFDAQKYVNNNEPFTDEDTKTILNDLGNTVDIKWIPYITTWLNKQLLWAKLCEGVTDTQELQDMINNKISNIDRIKSYLRGNDQNLKIDREYLYNYFKTNMSIDQFNIYHPINTDFVNKIINLNNFFLKKDDTNAHGVLKYTKYNGKEETDISKLSIFETGYMRKGYNYYQGGSEDMLIHSAQKIALNYMENVKNILNTDYNENNTENGVEFSLAA